MTPGPALHPTDSHVHLVGGPAGKFCLVWTPDDYCLWFARNFQWPPSEVLAAKVGLLDRLVDLTMHPPGKDP